jgi:GTP-binding protein EngB required for normal cell division
MNDNHHRHLLVTFRYIDNLLSEAEQVLATAGSASPFAQYTQDSTPVQRKVIHDYIQRVRTALDRAMLDLALPRPKPICGALWAARGHITFADIAVAEMEPERLLGYGPLSEADMRSIQNVVGELTGALQKLSAYVDKGPDADLQARLGKLEQTRDEVPLLRELERIITSHGLIEFRGALTLLLDRLENGCFEIGLFGRVSSGKSSLLNRLLGTEVLPVGVTPVTAIPTRVSFGPVPRAVIEFAESKSMEIALSRLAEFSTEQQNPDNTKHVTRIKVDVPAARLREGVTFVDTPGLGSLATSGAEETAAYLPRCDLGLVLLDAASTLTHEDLAVVQALYHAGARAMVLVSKADLLQPSDRERTIAYAKQQLATQLGVEPPVHLVSVLGADATLCDQWFERELRPLLDTHHEEAASSLKRKIGGLREAVLKTLESRTQSRTTATREEPKKGAVLEAITGLRRTDALLESAEKHAEALVSAIDRLAENIVSAAAAELAQAWHTRSITTPEAADLFSTAIRAVMPSFTTKLLRVLDELREQLENVLAHSRNIAAAEDDGEALPKPAGLPVFDPASIATRLRVPARPVQRFFGVGWLRRYAQAQLQEQLGRALPEFLDDYRRRLRQWLRQAMTELRAAFHSRAGILRAQLEAKAATAGAEADLETVRADLRHLREWAVHPSEQRGGLAAGAPMV